MNNDKIQISLKPQQSYEIEEMNNQLRRELNALNSNLYKISRVTTVKELFDLSINSMFLLSAVCRDKEYILSLSEVNKNE